MPQMLAKRSYAMFLTVSSMFWQIKLSSKAGTFKRVLQIIFILNYRERGKGLCKKLFIELGKNQFKK
jgi:hypothetical protein